MRHDRVSARFTPNTRKGRWVMLEMGARSAAVAAVFVLLIRSKYIFTVIFGVGAGVFSFVVCERAMCKTNRRCDMYVRARARVIAANVRGPQARQDVAQLRCAKRT